MKKTIILLGVLSVLFVFGQSTETSPGNKYEITPKTPDASQLSKFIDIPNATSTGTIGVDIPIYTLNADGFKLPIELKYHASGVRVKEVATKVGLGWSLSIGGISLSKQIFGAEDKGWIPYINPVSFNPNSNEKDNYLAATFTGFTALNPDFPGEIYDTQPDIYSYSAGKYSGEFYLSSTGQVIQVPYNNIKIELNNGLFEMTDDQGIKYFFSSASQTRTLGGSIPGPEDTKLKTTDFKINRILLPSGKEIKFNYTHTEYYKYISNSTKRYEISNDCKYAITSSLYREFNSETEVFREAALQSIEYGNERIEFTYSNSRQDLPGAPSLDKITVKNGNNQVLAYSLVKDYFNRAEESATLKRLKLKEVINLNDNSKYQLVYNEQFDLPDRLSDATDHLGFYNGANSSTGIPVTEYSGKAYGANIDKEPHLEYAVSGSLKKIVYPTGGSMEIEYENDDYYTFGRSEKLVKKSMLFDNFEPYFDFHLGPNNIVESDGAGKIMFNVTFTSEVNPPVESLTLPTANHFLGEIMDVNNNVLVSFVFTGSVKALVDKKDAYRVRIRKVKRPSEPGHQVNLDDYQATLEIGWTERVIEEIKGNYSPGGLRVKKIVKRDENNATARSIEYNYKDSEGKSTGIYVGDNINYQYTTPVRMNLNDPTSTVCALTIISNTGNFNTSTINGKPIIYNKVETKYIGDQENYKVADTYSNERGQNPIGLNNSLFTYFDGKYNLGQLQKQEYFNSSGQLVRSTDFEYENDYYFNKFSNDYNPAEPYLVIKPYSIMVNGYGVIVIIQGYPAAFRASFSVDRYQISSAWVKQKKIVAKNYLGNHVLSEVTDFFYDPSYKHLSPIKQNRTYLPDPEITETSYLYAHEKNNQKLINANMIGIPLETSVTKKQNENDPGKVISRIETKYNDPLTLFPTSVISNGLQGDTATEVTYDKYDAKGNLQQYTTKDGIPTVIIWGYNETQPIAKIKGVKLENIQQSLIDFIIGASNTDEKAGINNDETALLNALKDFKQSLPGYQISTYTYDPLVGIRSITPPSGITEYYHYDSANRLDKVTDANGKILKEMKYNYKN